MPRTFSLARLFLGITAFCLLCGLAVNFPELAGAYLLLVASFVPAGVVCLTLVSFSWHRKTVLGASLVGMAFGTGSPVHGFGSSMTVVDAVGVLFLPNIVSTTFCAAVLGTIALVVEALDSRYAFPDSVTTPHECGESLRQKAEPSPPLSGQTSPPTPSGVGNKTNHITPAA